MVMWGQRMDMVIISKPSVRTITPLLTKHYHALSECLFLSKCREKQSIRKQQKASVHPYQVRCHCERHCRLRVLLLNDPYQEKAGRNKGIMLLRYDYKTSLTSDYQNMPACCQVHSTIAMLSVHYSDIPIHTININDSP